MVVCWWWRNVVQAVTRASGYDFGIACLHARHSPAQLHVTQFTPVRHLALVPARST